MIRLLYNLVIIPLHLVLIVPFLIIAWMSRFSTRPIDVGIGPDTLINNVYHKKAVLECGYSAETFVFQSNYITREFDICCGPGVLIRFFAPYVFFLRALFRYKVLMMYFTGGSLRSKKILRWFEPIFYKAANVKTVLMPFGTDVQAMQRSSNLYFKHAMTKDYPELAPLYNATQRRVDRWTQRADWIISGCEWVDYMHHWDTLLLSHICIDLQSIPANGAPRTSGTFKILHAPNHLAQKGTAALMKACEDLKQEGLDLELVVLRKVPNTEVRQAIQNADLVADQFVIGWYAMFAIEAMAMKKPVLCYLRNDLIDLYRRANLIAEDEIPILNTSLPQIASSIKWAYQNRNALKRLGEKGREFVGKHHSVQRMSQVFSDILGKLAAA